MSILDDISKSLLVESMRRRMCGILKESSTLTSKQATDKSKFINEDASYEQLLNITLNPLRESKYLPAYVLEGAVAIIHRACLTGRKVIGINALTEGALRLKKETGAVITESMLDAAQVAVHDGIGLQIVGDVLKEATFNKDVLTAVDMLSHSPNARETADALSSLRSNGLSGVTATLDSMSRKGASRNDMLKHITGTMRQNEADRLERLMHTAGHTTTKDELKALRKAKKGADLFKTWQKKIGSGASATRSTLPPLPPNVSQRTHDIVAGASKGGMGLLPKIALGVGGTAAALWAWNKYNQNKRDMEG